MTATELAGRLHARRSGGGWTAGCPAHDDKHPSLSIHDRDGKVLLHCFAGCTVEAICAAIGIELRDLFLVPRRKLWRCEFQRRAALRARAEAAAWLVRDEAVWLRSHYADALRRIELLELRVGKQLKHKTDTKQMEAGWSTLARLAPISSFFLAAFNSIWGAPPKTMTRFVLASLEARRKMVFEGCDE